MPAGGRPYKVPKASPREDPFVWMSEQMNNTKPASRPSSTRKVSMSPAGKRRARSVGVSSSSRQRTHKRGPARRKSY